MAILGLLQLLEAGHKPALKVAFEQALKIQKQETPRALAIRLQLFRLLVIRNYTEAFNEAFKAAKKALSSPYSSYQEGELRTTTERGFALGLLPELNSFALVLLQGLISQRYKPAFEAATDAATQEIDGTDKRAHSRGIELFLELVKANYEPAFPAALSAAGKHFDNPDASVRSAARELKALIEQKQGT